MRRLGPQLQVCGSPASQTLSTPLLGPLNPSNDFSSPRTVTRPVSRASYGTRGSQQEGAPLTSSYNAKLLEKLQAWDRPKSHYSPQVKEARKVEQSLQVQPIAELPDLRHRFFVTCHPGLEMAVVKELNDLGIVHTQAGKAGVAFRSDNMSDGYRAVLWLRSAIRVLLELGSGDLDTDVEAGRRAAVSLYDLVRGCGIKWSEVIPQGATFSVDSRLWSCTDINSVRMVWQRVKDAVCDSVVDERRERPMPPAQGASADVPLYVSAYRDHVVIYKDLNGQSLHKRGYRDVMHRASLNEAAAAGLLILGGWKEMSQQAEAVLVDPMCGSGTLLVEGAFIACNKAPGLSRPTSSWPFCQWPDFEPRGWRAAVQEARDLERKWKGRLYGNDIHKGALGLAMKDMKTLGLQPIAKMHLGDCAEWELPETPTLMVANPPWGLRLMNAMGVEAEKGQDDSLTTATKKAGEGDGSDEGDVEGSWRSLSTFMRTQCGNSNALILSGNTDAVNLLRMRPSMKWKVTLGGVGTTLNKYFILPPRKRPSPQGADLNS